MRGVRRKWQWKRRGKEVDVKEEIRGAVTITRSGTKTTPSLHHTARKCTNINPTCTGSAGPLRPLNSPSSTALRATNTPQDTTRQHKTTHTSTHTPTRKHAVTCTGSAGSLSPLNSPSSTALRAAPSLMLQSKSLKYCVGYRRKIIRLQIE
jgi:hypothetical protein